MDLEVLTVIQVLLMSYPQLRHPVIHSFVIILSQPILIYSREGFRADEFGSLILGRF